MRAGGKYKHGAQLGAGPIALTGLSAVLELKKLADWKRSPYMAGFIDPMSDADQPG